MKNTIKTLQLLITSRCNSRCKMCNIWKTKSVNELSASEISDTINSFKSIENIDISGGEPFLRSDIEELLIYLNNNKNIKKISITSNGMLVDKIYKIFKNLKFKKKFKLFISLDGLKEKNDFLRIRGHFTLAINTLKKLTTIKNKYFKADISTTLNNYNFSDFFFLQKLVKKHFNISLTSINIPNKSEFYKNKNSKYLKLDVKNVPRDISHRDDIIECINTGDTKYKCLSPQNKLVLDASGNIRACSQHWSNDFIIGNIRDYNYDLNLLLDKNIKKYKEVCKRACNKQCNKCWTACEYKCWELEK